MRAWMSPLKALAVALLFALPVFVPWSQRAAASPPAIARVWHGRTPTAKADEYAKVLGGAITKFRTIPGNLGYQMMRETIGGETHFMVISYWTSRDAIHAYAGADIRKTRNLPRDPEFLIDPEQTVMNYDLVVDTASR